MSLVTLKIEAQEEVWPLKQTFRISRGSRTETEVVVVNVSDGEHIGRGEGVPIRRYNQTTELVLGQVDSIKREKGLDRNRLQKLLPPGAARNALDCALWDLEAKISGKRVWELANIPIVPEVETSFTISLDSPEKMAASAAAYVQRKEGRSPLARRSLAKAADRPRRIGNRRSLLKLKLGGDKLDLARIQAVRDVAPAVRLFIDANESWSPEHYRKLTPAIQELGVVLIEQPFPAHADKVLETLDHPIPICADESCHTTGDLPYLKKRYDVLNVKLDKTGGLTEALRLCQSARENGFKLLIGCMVCTSLGIAPARVLASSANYVDLDGPLLIARDREHAVPYTNGRIGIPPRELWG